MFPSKNNNFLNLRRERRIFIIATIGLEKSRGTYYAGGGGDFSKISNLIVGSIRLQGEAVVNSSAQHAWWILSGTGYIESARMIEASRTTSSTSCVHPLPSSRSPRKSVKRANAGTCLGDRVLSNRSIYNRVSTWLFFSTSW